MRLIDAKAYLLRYARLQEEIRELDADIERIESAATGLGINLDGMPHANAPTDPVGNTAAKVADLKRKKDELRIDALEQCEEIRNVIDQVTDSRYARLLSMRYLELDKSGRLQTWESIANGMCYNCDWVKAGLHSQALNAVRKVLEGTH